MFPLLKTGGLADVTGALPAAQIAEGWIPACCCLGFRRSATGSGSAGGGQQGDIRRADDAAVWPL
jgi:hypothetical protein